MKDYNYYKKSGQFNEDQLYEIKAGFDNGLTEDQIAIYARPEFFPDKMFAICEGFMQGLSLEQVHKLTKSSHSGTEILALIGEICNAG